MRITSILALVLLGVVSCRKSDNGGEEIKPAPVQTNENTFSIKVKDLFSIPGRVEDSKRKLSNIQVGDLIPYEIEISDTAEETVYSFFAVEEGTKFHQVLNKDYQLHIEAKEGEVELDPKQGIIKFSKKGTYTFYIKPLVAGTYRLLFNFQKQKEGKVVGKNLSQEILFNAVNIRVWWEREETQSSNMWRHSKHVNNFFFSIDDGNDQDDVYLTSREGIHQKYYLKYDGTEYDGDFNQGKIKFARSHEEEVSPPEVKNRLIERLRIVQIMPDKKQIEIDYHNIHF